ALAAGGVRVMEVTLRTPAGVAAIQRVAAEVPEVVVGAGSVRTPQELDAVCRVGASFVVLPGAPPRLLDAALDSGVPVVPGASTVTEMMALAERGIELMKFFPAEACGGARFLSSVAGPLPDLRFCPTGGVTAASAPSYLALPSVVCVGGSWLSPPNLLAAGDWAKITDLAAAAAGLRPTSA
ncbi:MAG TPA: bifunctional 4-hydroxy-2-oxoglutarate aldolase/2-dehydro-3-deoxy-phosphogluconate aldolase, partial [Pedococcus sp.]